jgi:hypothetical protein
MHVKYPLAYLFEAILDDGGVILQDPLDRSRRFPEIELIPVDGAEVAHRFHPDQAPGGVRAAIERGEEVVNCYGATWLWRTRTSTSDIQEYIDAHRIAFFTLRSVAQPTMVAAVRLLPIELAGFVPVDQFGVGDVLVQPPSPVPPIVTPFSLPYRLWEANGDGTRHAPPLKLVYSREVTLKGPAIDAMVLDSVAYQLGWECTVGDQQFGQVVQVR